jgi:hypothetical protein
MLGCRLPVRVRFPQYNLRHWRRKKVPDFQCKHKTHMHVTTAVDASQCSTTFAGKSQTGAWHPVSQSQLDILLARALSFFFLSGPSLSEFSVSLTISWDAPGLPRMWQTSCEGVMIRGPHKHWLLPICAQGGSSPQPNNSRAKRYEPCIFHTKEHCKRNRTDSSLRITNYQQQ